LLNARISDRSFSRWKKFPKIAQHLLNKFKLCLAQGQETETRLKELGCKNAQTMPNLKFSVPALPINQTYLNALLSFLNGKPSWIAASTHPGEEELIFNVHSQLKQKHTDLLTIIAPRHPNRAESLVKIAEAKGLNFQTLSSVLKNMDIDIDGIIVDEIGQLGTFYHLCDIVFMGGSLIPHGGHNPIEPIHFKKPVLLGPHMYNFREVCDLLSKAGPIFIKDETDLTKTLNYFFNNPNERSKISDQLYAILMTQQQSQIQLIERLWC
jgi:3-deoxy-D-manno-octulosonic-acid transferase